MKRKVDKLPSGNRVAVFYIGHEPIEIYGRQELVQWAMKILDAELNREKAALYILAKLEDGE